MAGKTPEEAWWHTAIIDMAPGRIALRGAPIQDLIGQMGFAEMIWFLARGERLEPARLRLLEAALVAAVDHGPQAPSIAAARMAMTCGVAINNAMATGLNMLGDVHGGAGAQAVELFELCENNGLEAGLQVWRTQHGPYLPGFGHRFHKDGDPRAPALLGLVDEAVVAGAVSGWAAAQARAIGARLHKEKGRPLPLNIDGATAVIFAELGAPPQLARGLFCLSRSVGLMAHAQEQSEQGGRNKGPTRPDEGWRYDGP